MRKLDTPTLVSIRCPECGSDAVTASEDSLRFVMSCCNCGHERMIIKLDFLDLFPEWFEFAEKEVE